MSGYKSQSGLEDPCMGIASRNTRKDCTQFQESHAQESLKQWPS